VARFSSWSFVTSTYDENAMASFVANTGPLSVCVDAITWYYYKGGKNNSEGDLVPKLTNAFTLGIISTSSNCGNSLNHCVMITGYDVVNGTPVWNVRNSYVDRRKDSQNFVALTHLSDRWGTNWGQGGYVQVQRGANVCNIAEGPNTVVI